MLNLVEVAVFWIYSTHFGLRGDVTGFGTALGKIVVAISGFTFGFISDNLSQNRIGRRKIFLVLGAPLLAISFIMLFIPYYLIPAASVGTIMIWFLVWNSTFHAFYGFLVIPYQSWMPEITVEDQRLEVSEAQNKVNLLASTVGLSIVFVIAGSTTTGNAVEANSMVGILLLVTVLVFSVIEILTFVPLLIMVKEPQLEVTKKRLKDEIQIVSENQQFKNWIFGQGFMVVGIFIFITLMLDLLETLLHLQGILEFLLFGVTLLAAVIFGFRVWGYIGHRYGKKNGLLLGIFWMLLTYPSTFIVQDFTSFAKLLQGVLFAGLIGIGLSAYFLFPYAILADIADIDRINTNHSRAGMYTGIITVTQNVFEALGAVLAGLLKEGSYGLNIHYTGIIAAAALIIALPFIRKGDFDPFMDNNHITPRDILRDLRAGQ